jgi:transcriptional regulator with XRE-family HTH domain
MTQCYHLSLLGEPKPLILQSLSLGATHVLKKFSNLSPKSIDNHPLLVYDIPKGGVTTMLILSQRLRGLREGIKISQTKLADLIGITQTSINRYETDGATPPPETLLWYADYFNVSLDYLFGRTDNPQGRSYEYQPKIVQSSEEMKHFVEMCFAPNSPMNDRLKQTLLEMLSESKGDAE